jgi:hypothetical protein
MQQYGKTLFGDPVIGFGRRAGWITKEVSKPAAHGVALTNAMRSKELIQKNEFA